MLLVVWCFDGLNWVVIVGYCGYVCVWLGFYVCMLYDVLDLYCLGCDVCGICCVRVDVFVGYGVGWCEVGCLVGVGWIWFGFGFSVDVFWCFFLVVFKCCVDDWVVWWWCWCGMGVLFV